MKLKNVLFLFTFAFILFFTSYQASVSRVPVSNTLSDFFVKFQSKFIALYTNTEDEQREFRVVRFGYNLDVDSANVEDVWSWGGDASGDNTMTYPTNTGVLTVVSTNVNDISPSGTGAQQVLITGIGIDSDGNTGVEITETIDMNGTTPTSSTSSFSFVNRVTVINAGTGQVNAGDIKITHPYNYVLDFIPTGDSISQQSIYKVPSDRRCFIDDINISADKLTGSDPRVTFRVKIFNSDTNTEYVIRRELLDTETEPRRVYPDFKDQAILPGEIINIEADSDTDNTEVSGTIYMICRKI